MVLLVTCLNNYQELNLCICNVAISTSYFIKDFLLSCRVLFRKIEDYIIYELSRNYNSKKIIIEFRETALNNKLVPNFLKSSYFELLNKNGKLSLYKIKPNKTLNETKKLFSSSS